MYKKSCIKCGEIRIRMRKATNQMVSDRALRNIRVDGVVCCLTVIGLALLSFIIANDAKEFFTFCAIAVGITVALLPGWWFLRVFPFRQKQIYHYKCPKCACTWDE